MALLLLAREENLIQEVGSEAGLAFSERVGTFAVNEYGFQALHNLRQLDI